MVALTLFMRIPGKYDPRMGIMSSTRFKLHHFVSRLLLDRAAKKIVNWDKFMTIFKQLTKNIHMP